MMISSGTKLGTYEVIGMLGAGGMGEVYRAQDSVLGREVAIKVLPAIFSSDRDRLRRFEQEARAAAALNHPNILSVYQFGVQDGFPYVVSELLQGETLRSRLQREALPVGDAVPCALQLARGLAAAHAKGIIHRDLKPENLFITRDGWLKILDFGLAKLLPAADSGAAEPGITLASGTMPGMLLGTVGYMSPEQARGQAVDARSDIFSLGAIFYELLSGQRAFDGPTSADVLSAILKHDPPPLVGNNQDISRPLNQIILRCLEKDRRQRFQSSTEVVSALEALPDTAAFRRGDLSTKSKTGVDRESETLGSKAPEDRSRKIARRALPWLMVFLIAAVLLVGNRAGGWWKRLRGGQSSGNIRSLAVLPLVNLSGDPGQEYFADGMTESMITELAQISALRVISRTSVEQYKGAKRPLPQIARELHVDGVVEGSVVRSGGKARITAQLIQAVPERHLWAKSYDRNLSDVLAIQSEVAQSIAQEIRVNLTPQEESRLQTARAVNPEAHDAYLRGRFYWNRGEPPDLDKARQYFQQALEKDPLYAPAYAGLADYYSVLPFYMNSLPQEVFPKAKAAVVKALELDDSLAEAHASRAYIQTYYDWNWKDADKEFQRALALNPNDATVHHRYSRYLSSMGRIAEALKEIKHAEELDPISPLIKANIGVVYYFGRNYDAAIDQLRSLLKENPNLSVAHWGLGLAYEQKGMQPEAVWEFEKADAISKHHSSNTLASLGHAYATAGHKAKVENILQDLRQLSKQEPVSGYQFALVFAGLGEKDRAVTALEKAFHERSTLLTYLKMDPRFDTLRSDPRVLALERRIGMPQ